MENDKILNSEQSIEIIHRMIKTAQHDLEDDSFYFLLWGWAVFAACTANFVRVCISFYRMDYTDAISRNYISSIWQQTSQKS